MSNWMLRAAAGLVACALACAPALAEEASGRWAGQLPPPVALHLVFSITKAPDGTYAGEMISPDQNPKPIPATKVEATGDHLVFSQDQLHLVYEAHWDEAKKAWVGTFTQGGQNWPLELVRDGGAGTPAPDPLLHSPLLPAVSGLDGRWQGELDLGAQKLRLVLRVVSQPGGVKAGMDSPDQGAVGLPVTALSRDGETVSFALERIGVSFKGVLSADGGSITGTFSQGGRDTPLTLMRLAPAEAAAKPRRPQEEAIAAAPVPYRAEDVTFPNSAAGGIRLAGTVTAPKGPGPFPAVVLISGSGPNARDENVLGHKIFLVLADHLTRRGLLVLRYDKRGIGQSKGDPVAATTADFASDATAAVAYLRSRPDVDPRRVGLIGHSEGGAIAPMVAAKDPSLAFVVMLAGPGVPGRKLIPEQARQIARASGVTQVVADQTYAMEVKIMDAVVDAKDADDVKVRVRAVLDTTEPKLPPEQIEAAVNQLAAGFSWMRFFLVYDPATALRQVRAPVLALNGSLDLQVPPAQNLPPIRAALADDKDVTVTEMAGLNHLFQHARTGSPAEYATIEETLAPELLKTVADWISIHVK